MDTPDEELNGEHRLPQSPTFVRGRAAAALRRTIGHRMTLETGLHSGGPPPKWIIDAAEKASLEEVASVTAVGEPRTSRPRLTGTGAHKPIESAAIYEHRLAEVLPLRGVGRRF